MVGTPLRPPATSGGIGPGAGVLVPTVVTLFFAWGFATVLIDTLIPKLKGLFALSYAEAMLTQFAFFIAYLLVSVPAGMLLARIGYLRAIVIGLVVMAGGCLMFAPAAQAGLYGGFLAALFIMACGITTRCIFCRYLMPSASAASDCPCPTDWMPARKISVMYAP